MRVRFVASTLALLLMGVSAAGQEAPKPLSPPDQQQGYTLQPGDQVDISVWGDPNASRSTIVAPDGMISYPLVGALSLLGSKAINNVDIGYFRERGGHRPFDRAPIVCDE